MTSIHSERGHEECLQQELPEQLLAKLLTVGQLSIRSLWPDFLCYVQRTTVAVTNRAGDTVAQFAASIVGTDASHDLAVLRIDAQDEDLQPIR